MLIYKERGGAAFGLNMFMTTHASWPFATIEIYLDKLIIKFLFVRLEFLKKDIEIEKMIRIFSKGIKIHNPKYKYTVFWSFHTDKLIGKFLESGYRIRESHKTYKL
ncbi:MAG: hypothetical protein U9R08_00130 [Nanoarchaeota archaeon]|nr:hypothetical protein [Nanoarchaeota archaeon]